MESGTSCVTSWIIIYPERARETLLRYLLSHYLPREGTRDTLALPSESLFTSRGHARHSCVTSWVIIYLERARKKILSYY